jgi:hypothetical protein
MMIICVAQEMARIGNTHAIHMYNNEYIETDEECEQLTTLDCKRVPP